MWLTWTCSVTEDDHLWQFSSPGSRNREYQSAWADYWLVSGRHGSGHEACTPLPWGDQQHCLASAPLNSSFAGYGKERRCWAQPFRITCSAWSIMSCLLGLLNVSWTTVLLQERDSGRQDISPLPPNAEPGEIPEPSPPPPPPGEPPMLAGDQSFEPSQVFPPPSPL